MKCSQVQNADFTKWYPKFKSLTLRSEIIPLPAEFIQFLEEDSIFVEDNAFPKPESGIDRYDYNEEEWESEDDEEDIPRQKISTESPTFPELEAKISSVIDEFGGSVFPKLNWSSPRDSMWMTTLGSLQCTNPSEIFLLLKSSDFVAHDLCHAYERCIDYEANQARPSFALVLKKWYDLKPAMEFRCFVKNNVLIGISQRDHASFYSYLIPMKIDIQHKIQEFFDVHIKSQYFDDTYVFDVYMQNMKVFIVDFNPWGDVTDPLLFDWEDLNNMELGFVDFRIVMSQSGIQPALSMSSRLPFDLKDFSSGSALSDFLEKVKEEDKKQSNQTEAKE